MEGRTIADRRVTRISPATDASCRRPPREKQARLRVPECVRQPHSKNSKRATEATKEWKIFHKISCKPDLERTLRWRSERDRKLRIELVSGERHTVLTWRRSGSIEGQIEVLETLYQIVTVTDALRPVSACRSANFDQTRDPLLSNRWQMHRPPEQEASSHSLPLFLPLFPALLLLLLLPLLLLQDGSIKRLHLSCGQSGVSRVHTLTLLFPLFYEEPASLTPTDSKSLSLSLSPSLCLSLFTHESRERERLRVKGRRSPSKVGARHVPPDLSRRLSPTCLLRRTSCFRYKGCSCPASSSH